MKILLHIVRYLVGIIFIFSGLVKLNDPVGTQIKLEEYFEVFATDFPAMHDFWLGLVPYALYFSILMSAAEVVLGVALLVSWQLRKINWILLLLIVFFTFLTFYSAYYNKVTDCGCFGDFIKLKPWTSFTKDVVLLILILFLIWGQKVFMNRRTGSMVGLSAILALGLAIYAIRYLPPFDFLPYKVGNNIPKLMQPSEPLRYKYIMEKDGKTQEFEQYPTDTTYKYKEMVLINENAKPKITDYKVWNETGDYTQETFKGKKFIIIIKNTPDLNRASLAGIKKVAEEVKAQGVEPIILTSHSDEEIKNILTAHAINIPYYLADATVLKTIIRSNPGIWLLQDGTVKGKWHYNTLPNSQQILKKL